MNDIRTRVMAAVAAEMNIWMAGYGHALEVLAAAVVAGRVPETDLTTFPTTEPTEDACRDLAAACDVPYIPTGDGRIYDEGWPVSVDGDDLAVAVESLLAIPAGDACRNDTTDGGVWQFWPDHLDKHNVTIDELRDHWRSLDLLGAAQLVVDANNRESN